MMTEKKNTRQDCEKITCHNETVSKEKGDFEIQRGLYRHSHLAEGPIKGKIIIRDKVKGSQIIHVTKSTGQIKYVTSQTSEE